MNTILKLLVLVVVAVAYSNAQITIPTTTRSSSSSSTTATTPCQGKYNKGNQFSGTCMPVSSCLGATLGEICANANQICCISDPDSQIVYKENSLISFRQYLEVLGDTPRNRHLYPLFSRSMDDAQIKTCHQAAAFFAQIRGETNDLKSFEEGSRFSSVNDFDTNLGNNETNDGAKYRGRGALYIRGKGNYLNATDMIPITKYNLLIEPEAAAFPTVGFRLASYVWTRNSYLITENKPARKGSLNLLADGTFHNFTLLTHALTTNIQSLKDRASKYEAHVKTLKCTTIKRGRGVKCELGARFGIAVPICLIDYKKPFCGCEGDFQVSSCPYGYSANQCRSSSIIKCCVEKCERYLDLAIIIDSSGSITFNQYQKAKRFVRTLVSDLEIGESATRVAIINYSIDSEILLNLSSIYDKQKLIETIDAIEHQSLAGTNTQLALQQTNEIIFQEENGMRPQIKGVPKVAVIITDGASNIDEAQTVPNAEILKKRGVSIISVGVGDEINQIELEQMATNADDVYNIENYDQIFEIVESLSRSICEQSARAIPEEAIEAQVKQSAYTYFKVDLNTSSSDKFSVGLTDISGSSRLFYSFDEENPKDDTDFIRPNNEQIDQSFIETRTNRAIDKFYEICKPVNKTSLFMSVKGLGSVNNQFRMYVYNRSVISASCGSSILNDSESMHQTTQIWIVNYLFCILTWLIFRFNR